MKTCPLMAGGCARVRTVYERHSGAAYSLAYRMVGTRSVAEDVTQEAFLNTSGAAVRTTTVRGSVRTWIPDRPSPGDRRAAAGPVHFRAPDDETAAERLEAPTVEEDVARRDEAAIVRNAMDIHPPSVEGHRARLLRRVHTRGIAEMLEAPIGPVKGRMRLGLKKMREVLAQERSDDGSERWEDAAGATSSTPSGRGAHRLRASGDLRGMPRRVAELPWPPRRYPSRRRRCSAARAEGADHGRVEREARCSRPRAWGRRAGTSASPLARAAPSRAPPGRAACASSRRRRLAPVIPTAGTHAPSTSSLTLPQALGGGQRRRPATVVANGLPTRPPEPTWSGSAPGHAPEPTSALFTRAATVSHGDVTGDLTASRRADEHRAGRRLDDAYVNPFLTAKLS
jgi:RNA polymerase sigma-70 factor (ECF subfamily)